MSWKQFYTSASYLRRVKFIFSLGHRWNEFVSHNPVCNKFISWSQNYWTTQLNIAWRNWSLEMETSQWILGTEVHFQCMKKCKIPRQSILSGKILCIEMASFLLSSLPICTTLWLYDLLYFHKIYRKFTRGVWLSVKHPESYNFPILGEQRVCVNCRSPEGGTWKATCSSPFPQNKMYSACSPPKSKTRWMWKFRKGTSAPRWS